LFLFKFLVHEDILVMGSLLIRNVIVSRTMSRRPNMRPESSCDLLISYNLLIA